MTDDNKTIYEQARDDMVAIGLLQHAKQKEFFVRTEKAKTMGWDAFNDAFQMALAIREQLANGPSHPEF